MSKQHIGPDGVLDVFHIGGGPVMEYATTLHGGTAQCNGGCALQLVHYHH